MKLFYFLCVAAGVLAVICAVFGIRESNPALMYHAYESAVASVLLYIAAEPAKQLWLKIKSKISWVDAILFLPIIILLIYAFGYSH